MDARPSRGGKARCERDVYREIATEWAVSAEHSLTGGARKDNQRSQ